MLNTIFHRLLQSVVVIVLMSFVVYMLIGLMPGDPIDLMISSDPRMTAEDAARLRQVYGLDQPLWDRYMAWATGALSGEFGYSRLFGRPVIELMGPRLLNTFLLMLSAWILAVIFGLGLGILAGARQGGIIDTSVNWLAFVSASTPTFWLALLLMILFSVQLQLLPASGFPTSLNAGFGERLRHLVLPVLTLAIFETGAYARYMRAAMMEALNADHVRTARAKGASRVRVVLVHALRNAMIPVVTIMALGFGNQFSGALITETMFSYPGMGKMIFDSVMGNDFNLALVALLFATAMTLAANLIADLAYVMLDPRISYAARPGGAAR
ncbi:MAG: ABC transporter permease [Alphaproteobacteria bacterium]|nr:ABC transporter permease [Alphaproteobacteria bacterium]